MKARHGLILYIIGFLVDMVGAVFKILHLPGGDEILMIGGVLQIVGGLLFLYKFIKYPGFKDFLDS